MNYKLYKNCRFPATITTKIFLLKLLFVQKNPKFVIFRLIYFFYENDKKITFNNYLYYQLKVASIIPYIITSVSLGFVIFLLAKVVNHTLSK